MKRVYNDLDHIQSFNIEICYICKYKVDKTFDANFYY